MRKYGAPKKMKACKKSKDDKFLDTNEVRMLLTAAREESERDAMILFFAANLGFRQGEIVKLCKKDFYELREGIVYVNTLKLKTPVRDRKYVSETTAEVIKKYLSTLPMAQEWLFPGADGKKHLSERSARNIFNYYAKKVGIREQVSLHSLRHYHGTMLRTKAGDLYVVADGMRHRNVKSTDVYMHVTESERRAVADKLETIW